MEPHINFITLRVEDLEEATRFYTEGLGWPALLTVSGEVTFIQAGHGLTLSLFDAKGFDADAGGRRLAAPMTLAHNVGSEAEVRAAVESMVAAGGTVVKEPLRAEWGGYHALVTDPAGFGWEIAYNPYWSVDADGTVKMGGD